MNRYKSSLDAEATLQTVLEKKTGDFMVPIVRLVQKQSVASLLLLVAIFIALLCANLFATDPIQALGQAQIGFVFHKASFVLPIQEWVNSGLMTLFFFLLGLEIKREILVGELRNPGYINFVLAASLGGMVVPALLYIAITYTTPGALHGWAIPMATDTAFAIGVLAVLARRISAGVSIFLVAFAIFDDIGAILVVALFYSHGINSAMLICAALTFIALLATNTLGFRKGSVFAILGVMLWVFMHESGIHATLTGILVAIAIPAKARITQTGMIHRIREVLFRFESNVKTQKNILESSQQHALTEEMEKSIMAASTPLRRWEVSLITPIAIIALPVFALFNAGITFSEALMEEAMRSPVMWGVMVGLVIGKPLGISLFCYIAYRFGIGRLPPHVSAAEIFGVGILGGVGFTMSVFITTLSFEKAPQFLEPAKLGIMLAAPICALGALGFLYWVSRHRTGDVSD